MKIGGVEKLPQAYCLNCKCSLNAASHVGGEDKPAPGDSTVCIRCGHVMIFTENWGLRELTADENKWAESDEKIQAIKKAQKAMHSKQLLCSKQGCLRPATCAPRICIPAQGHPILPGKQCTIVVGLPMCDNCLKDFDKNLVLNDSLKASFRQRFAELKKAPPDFERAYVVACPADHPDFQHIHRKRAEREEAAKTQAVSNKKPAGLSGG